MVVRSKGIWEMMNKYISELIAQNQDGNLFLSGKNLNPLMFKKDEFSDINDFLPLMKLDENGRYRSDNILTLTQRPSLYGPILGASIGRAFVNDDDELIWESDEHSDQVIGWMYIPSTQNIQAEINFSN